MSTRRYHERAQGVYDQQADRRITPRDKAAWAEYLAWLAAGNEPLPLPQPRARDLEDENRAANALAAIVKLERSQARALRELAIGTAEEKAAAIARLRDIEDGIKAHRVHASARPDKPATDKGDARG